MRIKWLGHASFVIETGGLKIVTDPFDEKLGYPIYNDPVQIATVSHDHWDHNAVHALKGSPQVIKGTGEFLVQGITIKGVASFHDKSQGNQRGDNTIFKISSEKLDLVHLGDLGHRLEDRQIAAIGNVDILLIPVGGTFTIDAQEALDVAAALNPKVIIPMHYNTPHLSFDLAPVEAFTSHFDQVVKRPFLEVDAQSLREMSPVLVLEYLC